VFHMVSCVPQNEMVVLAGDMNGHVGNSNVSKGLRDRLGLDEIILVLQPNRLPWYGHVLQKEDNDWAKKCMEYEVECAKPRGRAKETWTEIVEKTVRKVTRSPAKR